MKVGELDWQQVLDGAVGPGDVLADRYRVDGVIGAGGMGVVLLGWHLGLNERIAIKVLHPQRVANPEARRRFEREARATVQIRSEHVAQVLDIGALGNGLPYMVLEYLQGRSLARVLVENGPLPIPTAVAYVLQACEAVAEAHSLGIVHRDLKPANLLLTQSASGAPIIKVLDFGLAKAEQMEGTLTVGDRIMGTPRYMSPEQWVSTRDVGPATDIWALGVTLFELCTGAGPFPSDEIEELCQLVLSSTPSSLSSVRSDAPPELEAVLATCLQRNPKRRYEDVPAFAAALAGALPGSSGPGLVSDPAGAAPLGAPGPLPGGSASPERMHWSVPPPSGPTPRQPALALGRSRPGVPIHEALLDEPTEQALGDPPVRAPTAPAAATAVPQGSTAVPPDEDATHQYRLDELVKTDATLVDDRTGDGPNAASSAARTDYQPYGEAQPSSPSEPEEDPEGHRAAGASAPHRAKRATRWGRLLLLAALAALVVVIGDRVLGELDDGSMGRGASAGPGGRGAAGGAALAVPAPDGGEPLGAGAAGGDDFHVGGQRPAGLGGADGGLTDDAGLSRPRPRYWPQRRDPRNVPIPWDLR